MPVNINLPDDRAVPSDEDHDFASGIEGAGEVVIELPDVSYHLIAIFGDGGSANPHAHWNVGVIGRGSDVRIQHEGCAFQPVDPAPVVALKLIQRMHRFFTEGKPLAGRLANPVQNLGKFCTHGL